MTTRGAVDKRGSWSLPISIACLIPLAAAAKSPQQLALRVICFYGVWFVIVGWIHGLSWQPRQTVFYWLRDPWIVACCTICGFLLSVGIAT